MTLEIVRVGVLLVIVLSAARVGADRPNAQDGCAIGDCVDGSASGADRLSFIGEWSGYEANQRVLVKLRVSRRDEPTMLALSEWRDGTPVTSIHVFGELRVGAGRFTAAERSGAMKIEGEAKVYLDSGYGRMQVSINENSRQRKLDIPIQRSKGKSWPQLVLGMYEMSRD
jgi:hypothetical protein